MYGEIVIQTEYCFMTTRPQDDLITALVGVDDSFGRCVVISVKCKGARDVLGAKALAAFVRSLGRPRLVIQGDGEHSMVEFVRQTCDELPRARQQLGSGQTCRGRDEDDHVVRGNQVLCGNTDGSPSGAWLERLLPTHAKQWTKQQQVPAPSCRAVVSMPRDLPIPPSRRRVRCLKSGDQEDAQSQAFCLCPVLCGTRKGAQVAREMDTTTTHNVNVELRTEQRGHLTWEVPIKLKVKLPEEQQAHLKLQVRFKMSVEAMLRHLTLEVQGPAKLRLRRESRPSWATSS